MPRRVLTDDRFTVAVRVHPGRLSDLAPALVVQTREQVDTCKRALAILKLGCLIRLRPLALVADFNRPRDLDAAARERIEERGPYFVTRFIVELVIGNPESHAIRDRRSIERVKQCIRRAVT